MADNRVAYGLAKKYGIDTTGMSPKEVWEALRKKGITVENVSDGAFNSQSDGVNNNAEKITRKYYSKKLDRAVMNRYSTVRKWVNKKGYATVKVNDGKNFYIIRINKSEDDFNYDIIKAWKIND